MLETTVRYLCREKVYKVEKPYSADFEVDECEGVKRSNLVTHSFDVYVSPITNQSGFEMNVNGFCVLKEKTSLTIEEALYKPDQVELRYQTELEMILHEHFPEYTRLEPLDFVVRKRDPIYPTIGRTARFEQPSAVTHSDYTAYGAIEQLKGSFPGQEGHFKKGKVTLMTPKAFSQSANAPT